MQSTCWKAFYKGLTLGRCTGYAQIMHFPPLSDWRPRSAKATLAVIALVASTLLMGMFAAGSYWMTEQRLTAQRAELWAKMQRHLGQPVAQAVWNFDLKGLNAVLGSELGGSVLGVAVVNESGKLVAQVGLALAQLVGVSLVLLAVVWVGVDLLIFRRVHQLQQALDHATGREQAVDIVALPEAIDDEFGAITRSINAITTRLGDELEAGRASEDEARTALAHMESAQEGLVRAEKMAALGRLVAGVAHELNTPIGNIMMVASTQQEVVQKLSESVASGGLTRNTLISLTGQIDEGSGLMLSSARRAAELIQNFKQVAVDQTTDQLRDFELDRQIAEMLSVIAHVLSQTPIKLVQQLEPGIAMHSYPGPLGQVLTNLVMNAAKHGFNDTLPGTITVASARQGDRACITVTDNGAGIPPENVGKIFDPFFTTKLGQGGTGLGLHISHNMVYGPLGGRMTVLSTPVMGTVFTLLLPLTAPDSDRL